MRRSPLKLIVLPILMGCVVLSARDTSAVFVSRDAYLMGTHAQLSTYATTRDGGLAALESALGVIEDTEEELSTWRRSSQISALNRHPVGERRKSGNGIAQPMGLSIPPSDNCSPRGTFMAKELFPHRRSARLRWQHRGWRSLRSTRAAAR